MNLFAETPENWTKASVGTFCEVQLGKMLQNDPSSERDELKPYLKAINVGKEGLDLSHEFSMWIRPQEADRFRLIKGDILVSEGGDAGRTVVFDADGEYYFQNAINRVRPNHQGKIVPEFIYYWFTFLKITGYVEMICNVATIPHFTAEKVKTAPLALPSLDTQRCIARFLDEKTTRIDGLIEKKRLLLEQLAEKRHALISRAVTKGLKPDALMKPSGIDWLGSIPAHWQVIALNKVTTKITNGYVGPTRDIFVPEGVRYIQSLHIKDNRILFGGDYFVQKEWSNLHAKSILALGDVLVVQTGDIGQVAHVTTEHVGCNCHALIICSPRTDLLIGEFLSWALCSDYGQRFLQLVKTGALHPHLNCGNVKYFPVVIPPLKEQAEINVHVRGRIHEHHYAQAQIELSMAKLKEYREAIITDAVKGKIAELR
ncbi:MAG: restriction endonuclease subunit S [Boseongicola sp. SB0664_bin_43]|uniref:Restriction endonuclease subunit S n=1 Tax=Boseongicola sp. SB0664_bin_43 TaxID=2604844 RepID=A0A6B0XWE2_9RHOB|nr:restriction endonuclease subunit S [Boseongicola sp. SB0664_bin_43]MYG83666.1 restriction endonuclease subunit S [Gemmatimonadota bacterium]